MERVREAVWSVADVNIVKPDARRDVRAIVKGEIGEAR
jgi:hypothetical protein